MLVHDANLGTPDPALLNVVAGLSQDWRFGDRLRYQIDVDEASRSAKVPRLAVQTIVENSVKYAVSPRREGASIRVRAAASDGRLRVAVEDDGPGFGGAARPAGHGLDLLGSRLRLLFGDRATLTVDSGPPRTVVAIDLPAESRS